MCAEIRSVCCSGGKECKKIVEIRFLVDICCNLLWICEAAIDYALAETDWEVARSPDSHFLD